MRAREDCRKCQGMGIAETDRTGVYTTCDACNGNKVESIAQAAQRMLTKPEDHTEPDYGDFSPYGIAGR